MIAYESGTWAIGFALQARGSVVPKAMCWAAPIGACAVVTFWLQQRYYADVKFTSLDTITNAYNVVLGFLLVYRAQTAFSRFWDGATHLYTLKATWFNVVSAIFAFCSADPAKAADVQQFQHQLIRLISLLYGSALQTIAGPGDGDCFYVLNMNGLETQKIEWVECQHDKLEVVMQWVQHLVVDMHRKAIIDIPPPILSRVFQELGNGMIFVANAKRIVKFPFPFPYAQMISLMLMAHGIVTIFVAGLSMSTWYFAFFYAFFSCGTLWAINYIAIEIEMPFGQDPNDLPLESMQKSMNDCLIVLLHPLSQHAPLMDKITGQHLTIDLKPWTIGSDLRVETYNAEGDLQYELQQPLFAEEPIHEPVGGPVIQPPLVAATMAQEPKLVGNATKDVIASVVMESQLDKLVSDLRSCSESIAYELRQLTHALADEHRIPQWGDVENQCEIAKCREATRESTSRECRMESDSVGYINPVFASAKMRSRMARQPDESAPPPPITSPTTEL